LKLTTFLLIEFLNSRSILVMDGIVMTLSPIILIVPRCGLKIGLAGMYNLNYLFNFDKLIYL
jgi:hypothetical protein